MLSPNGKRMGRPPIGGWPETENPVTENFVDTEEFKLAVAEAAKLAARSAVEEFQTELKPQRVH